MRLNVCIVRSYGRNAVWAHALFANPCQRELLRFLVKSDTRRYHLLPGFRRVTSVSKKKYKFAIGIRYLQRTQPGTVTGYVHHHEAAVAKDIIRFANGTLSTIPIEGTELCAIPPSFLKTNFRLKITSFRPFLPLIQVCSSTLLQVSTRWHDRSPSGLAGHSQGRKAARPSLQVAHPQHLPLAAHPG